jgi:hypothetical protein
VHIHGQEVSPAAFDKLAYALKHLQCGILCFHSTIRVIGTLSDH